MRDYSQFTVDDFIQDEFFQSWIWHPDAKTNDFWQKWLAAHPHKLETVEEARQLLQKIEFPQHRLSHEEVSDLWIRIRNTDYQPVVEQRSHRLWYITAASVILIALLIPLRWWLGNSITEHHTKFGETQTIVLPDSSTVILNANSRLSYDASDWDDAHSTRSIWLDGEAFFSVVHKVDHQPFKVTVGDGVSVEVLGTTFNVSHRSANTRVVLNTGQIRLSLPATNSNEKILMEPGEMVEYTNRAYQKRKVDPERFVAWTQNKLVLDRTSLREMVEMLESNYGLKVQVRSEVLLDQTVSGSMPLTDGVTLAQQIAKAFRLKVVQEGDVIVITE